MKDSRTRDAPAGGDLKGCHLSQSTEREGGG